MLRIGWIVSQQFPTIMKHGEGFKPNNTFREADRRSDGLEQGEREKNTCFGDLKFPTKPVENLLFYLHRVSVGDYLPGKGPDPQNSPHS